jgi:hypothetical protein
MFFNGSSGKIYFARNKSSSNEAVSICEDSAVTSTAQDVKAQTTIEQDLDPNETGSIDQDTHPMLFNEPAGEICSSISINEQRSS